MNDNGHRSSRYWVVFILVAVVVLLAVASLFFGVFASRPATGFYYPFFPFAFFWGFLIFFLIFGAFRWVFWGWGWGYRRHYGRYYDRAHQILRERYARGEITKEQFEQMERDLEQHR